jgi:hypothetical protein
MFRKTAVQASRLHRHALRDVLGILLDYIRIPFIGRNNMKRLEKKDDLLSGYGALETKESAFIGKFRELWGTRYL